ncbi:MAG TPA: M20/M25/M40 family metallo-hydrolase [Gemmatimonadaceae bacterium]|nr:M20/M25/M40 family metallo-hydrolase [Gemmatimonadaceae bacterium]
MLGSRAVAQAPTDPTAALLVDLIRVNTSNPPGNEGGVAALLAPRFKALGFEVDTFPTPAAGKTHFVARLRGNGKKRPVLIAAHADVVGVERDKWSVDPFAGIVKDGYVYGRGAIDFKGGMAVFARAAMQLAERKVPLDRDVIFVAEADEEGALPYSADWLAKCCWQKIDAEFALNEGGWIIQRPDGSVRYVSISTADKGAFLAVVTARGTSTHASMPRPDNAIFTLGKALSRLADQELSVTFTPSTRRFFEALGRSATGAEATAYRDLLSGDSTRVARGDRQISEDPLLHALLRTTWAPVLINGGFRQNVIPGSAEATLNVRTLPGANAQSIVARMSAIISDPAVTVTLPSPAFGEAIPESSDTTALFRALVSAAHATYPGAEVTPYLFQAGTDAAAWRMRGVPVYGIYPYAISAEDLKRMHGNDERVAIASLARGTEMIYRTLVEVAGTK